MVSEAGADVLELAPLRGLRYASPDARALVDSPAFNIALALAPPYDVLDAESLAELVRTEPHNAARLTAPPVDPPPPDRYRTAARTLRRWIDDGVLVRDPAPVLYVYEQVTPGGCQQRGLIGALRLPPPGSAVVRPHEDVADGPVADRVELMAATRANLEPIFLLYRGGRGAATRSTDAMTGSPLVDTVTKDGIAHRLWAIDDPATHTAIAADLATRGAMIADGHHRYAAYQRLRAGSHGVGPWGYGLAMLVDSEASPPHVGAIHRVLRGLRARTAADAAAEVATVERLPAQESLTASTERLQSAAADGPALLLTDPQSRYLLHDLARDRLAEAAPEHSAEWRAMPSVALDRLLLPLWSVGDDAIEVVHDAPERALAATRAGDGASHSAVLLPPPRVEDVYAITARGELMPRKSTSFGPKPRTGLVLRRTE